MNDSVGCRPPRMDKAGHCLCVHSYLTRTFYGFEWTPRFLLATLMDRVGTTDRCIPAWSWHPARMNEWALLTPHGRLIGYVAASRRVDTYTHPRPSHTHLTSSPPLSRSYPFAAAVRSPGDTVFLS